MAKKKSKSIFESLGWKVGMKYLYGIGAAVVIVGALFKILHLPGANEMLIVGLGTEAVIFFFSAFEPLPHEEIHWEWNKVFPQLLIELDEDELAAAGAAGPMLGGGGGAQKTSMDPKALEAMNKELTPDLFVSLSSSIKGLKSGVEQIADIAGSTLTTNEYNNKVKEATSKIGQLAADYGTSVDTMKKFNEAMVQVKNSQEAITKDVKSYQTQLQTVTKHLTSLSAIYEIELQDAQKHIGSVTKFYAGISAVMQNLLDTSKDTDKLRIEVSALATNMQKLNTIYGNMLTAMTGK